MGIYGSRNLTEFDLGTNYDSVTYDFVTLINLKNSAGSGLRKKPELAVGRNCGIGPGL